MPRIVRKFTGRIALALGAALAAAFILAWFVFVMPEAFRIAEGIRYPIKFLATALFLGLVIAAGIFWPFEWVSDHVDPDTGDDKQAGK